MHFLASLAVLAVGLSTIGAQETIYYTPSAYLPGSELDGQIINAAALGFYLGLAGPSSYCPAQVQTCPKGDSTVVYGGLQVSVEVPGGQQTYVAPNGAISYTQAHSMSMPAGSYQTGFTSFNITSNCATTKTIVSWQTPNNSSYAGLLACPPPYYMPSATYQIYARTPLFNQSHCVPLVGILQNVRPNNDFGAWQYA